MPYARKTLTQLRDDIINDINSGQITDSSGNLLVALLSKAVLRAVAYAQAGVGYEHYSELDWISLQAVPWTATDEFLEGWAGLKGVTREAATATQGTSTYTGTAAVPIGTSIVRNDGVQYLSAGNGVVSGGSITVPMTAVTAGSAGNFEPNTVFTMTGVPGVMATSTASAQTVAGADEELDDSLRSRMLAVYAEPPQGGDRNDYIEWALNVAGVTRAWVAPNLAGPGTVTVFFMMDDAEAAFQGFPQGTNGVASNEPRAAAATGDQLTVANALYVEAPVTSLVYSNAPAGSAVNFTIINLGAGNTPTNQTAITAALTDMFLRLGNVGGTVQPQTGAAWPPIEPDAWYEAIESVSGLSGFAVTAPTAPITPGTGQLPVLGTITFSS